MMVSLRQQSTVCNWAWTAWLTASTVQCVQVACVGGRAVDKLFVRPYPPAPPNMVTSGFKMSKKCQTIQKSGGSQTNGSRWVVTWFRHDFCPSKIIKHKKSVSWVFLKRKTNHVQLQGPVIQDPCHSWRRSERMYSPQISYSQVRLQWNTHGIVLVFWE